MSNTNSINITELNKIQENYYNSNSKNILFKKTQKFDCAKEICKNIDINAVLSKTIYIVPNTNSLYMNYPLFKLFANPDIFDLIVDHIITMCRSLIDNFGWFDVYVNLESFSVSAAERYKPLIQSYNEKCLNKNTDFALLMKKLNILNTPSVIEMIVKILKSIIDKNVYEKVNFIKKGEESKTIIDSINNSSNN
jgi:hypothetical protein